MTQSFPYLLLCLIIGIALIVVLTTRYRVPAFFALVLSAMLVGLGVGMPLGDVITTMKDGFGRIMSSLGLIIVLGATLGVMLEHTGATAVMAGFILRQTGEKNAAWAMSVTGFIVGLPIFCDSGFIVLSGLNKNLAKRAGVPLTIMSASLATGLLAVHCMAPPHPGATTAAVTIGADLGKMIVYGALVAIPAMIVGNLWARYAGKKLPDVQADELIDETPHATPSVFSAFLPVITPIVLIALKSFYTIDAKLSQKWLSALLSIGDPVPALMIGVLLTFLCKPGWSKKELSHLLQDSVEKAGGILIIIGAGGAFGAILAATKIGVHFSQVLNLGALGIFFPFLLTAILKTAQGSSTVAIITAASIVQPLLLSLGLDSPDGKLLCVLAMGAGSMILSHANDAYFWVIAKFSGIDMKTMLRVYSVATLLMGITSILMVFILSKII
ncbi:MAG TPA: GntP family permease [Mucilaginibacter sp.]|jgi:GntP family gluconate:H+ symporter|nr:GntP family permease [Mucilaginibacter sp.]